MVKVSKPCVGCRESGKDCEGYEDYNYREFRYCQPQTKWIVKNHDDILESLQGNAIHLIAQNQRFGNAGYTAFASILGEVMGRLEKTKTDGKLLIAELKAKYECLSDESNLALLYITGWKTKKLPYTEWAAQRRLRLRRKKHENNKSSN